MNNSSPASPSVSPTNSSPPIYIDLDGVLVDFFSAAIRTHGRPDLLKTFPQSWPAGEREIAKVLGITDDEFWAKIDERATWWMELDAYEWWSPLLTEVELYAGDNWRLLSTPSRHHFSAGGKWAWVEEIFGRVHERLILTKEKWRLAVNAGAGGRAVPCVLIDDNDKNCEKWAAAGGHAILFPQPWNKRAEMVLAGVDRMEVVEKELEEIFDNCRPLHA
jgi:5'(3')-deoxyribonucleotidase